MYQKETGQAWIAITNHGFINFWDIENLFLVPQICGTLGRKNLIRKRYSGLERGVTAFKVGGFESQP
jgi:hypothetical protein